MPYTKPDNLLPLDKVLSIVARVAEALDYAHKQNVVHRDIKPANIMYEPESDTVEGHRLRHRAHHRFVQDQDRHGARHAVLHVARAAGGQEDRRAQSDLFSLGVTLYQMSCGQLPFQGDSMAQLMFKIANEPHADIRTHQSGVACRAWWRSSTRRLPRMPGQRYQNGSRWRMRCGCACRAYQRHAGSGRVATAAGGDRATSA